LEKKIKAEERGMERKLIEVAEKDGQRSHT